MYPFLCMTGHDLVNIGLGSVRVAHSRPGRRTMLERVATAPPQIPGLSDWRALARGGFAIVWQAKQESLNRFVAVKVDQRTLDIETEQRRFLREAGAAGRLSGKAFG